MKTIGLIFRRMTVLAVILTFTGCASFANNIKAAQVSPLKYQQYNCDQIAQEISRVDRELQEVSSCQDSEAVKDTVALLVCPLVLWPVLFLVNDGDKSDELSQLKGEYDALKFSAVEKQCTVLVAKLEELNSHQTDKESQIVKQQQKISAGAENNES